MVRDYYELAKPGLVYGNLIPMAAGFALGARWHIDPALFALTAAGLALVMASGCVFNNWIDRDIDANMERTRNRALVTGRVSSGAALVYGTILGLAGFFLLGYFTNFLAAVVAGVGFFFYVFMYSLWFKRRTVHATLIGSIAGAVPPVVGYAAATNRLDGGALLLFLILVLWQMPHFYAIGIRRFGEYAAAGIPILPIKNGISATKIRMLIYIIAFTFTAPLLTLFGYLDLAYLVISLVLGAAWLLACLSGFKTAGAAADTLWARTMFFSSLVVMVALFAAIAVHG